MRGRVLDQIAKLKLPKIHPSDASYRGWLSGLRSTSQNKKALLVAQKNDVDNEYVQALKLAFPHEEKTVERLSLIVGGSFCDASLIPVSYTHLTLPTKRIV